MKRHIARHFSTQDYEIEAGKEIPNKFRHLCLPLAANQANIFRHKLDAEKPYFALLGHSVALRTQYSLHLGTVGMTNGAGIVEVDHLFPKEGPDYDLMMAAYKEHGLVLMKYSPDQLAAVDRLGKLAADAIIEAEKSAGIPDNTEVLYFGHAPVISAVSAALVGTCLANCPALRMETSEGDRFVLSPGEDVRFVPLAN